MTLCYDDDNDDDDVTDDDYAVNEFVLLPSAIFCNRL